MSADGARLTIRLEQNLRRRLSRLAKSRSQRASEVVRDALEAYCRSQENGPTCYDLAAKAGVLGVAKRLPADLSSNPRHLAGLGQS